MEWIYETNEDNSARFVLGQVFDASQKTLICFGINPSTASPECLDNTIRKVINISKNNGYENWIMLNIYPQRATNPKELHKDIDNQLFLCNMVKIKEVAEKYTNSDVLLAYGNLIDTRKYFKDCLNKIIEMLGDKPIKIIKLTKSNNPVHPLYQKNDVMLVPLFDCVSKNSLAIIGNI